jgi:hypothetical protein
MRKSEIRVGHKYTARASGQIVNVRVDAIRQCDRITCNGVRSVNIYDVTNLRTGRKLTFRSAAKFRSRASVAQSRWELETNKGRKITWATDEAAARCKAELAGCIVSSIKPACL